MFWRCFNRSSERQHFFRLEAPPAFCSAFKQLLATHPTPYATNGMVPTGCWHISHGTRRGSRWFCGHLCALPLTIPKQTTEIQPSVGCCFVSVLQTIWMLVHCLSVLFHHLVFQFSLFDVRLRQQILPSQQILR